MIQEKQTKAFKCQNTAEVCVYEDNILSFVTTITKWAGKVMALSFQSQPTITWACVYVTERGRWLTDVISSWASFSFFHSTDRPPPFRWMRELQLLWTQLFFNSSTQQMNKNVNAEFKSSHMDGKQLQSVCLHVARRVYLSHRDRASHVLHVAASPNKGNGWDIKSGHWWGLSEIRREWAGPRHGSRWRSVEWLFRHSEALTCTQYSGFCPYSKKGQYSN